MSGADDRLGAWLSELLAEDWPARRPASGAPVAEPTRSAAAEQTDRARPVSDHLSCWVYAFGPLRLAVAAELGTQPRPATLIDGQVQIDAVVLEPLDLGAMCISPAFGVTGPDVWALPLRGTGCALVSADAPQVGEIHLPSVRWRRSARERPWLVGMAQGMALVDPTRLQRCSRRDACDQRMAGAS